MVKFEGFGFPVDNRIMTQLTHLMQAALSGDKKAEAKLKASLQLDELNWNYFRALYLKKVQGSTKEKFRLFDPGESVTQNETFAFPTAVAPPDLMNELPQVDYCAIRTSAYSDAARDVVLWVKKMQAGSGSSMTRTS